MQGLAVQRRVILALMLRETHTIYGDSKLGYLWVIIQTMFGIGVFWGVREFLNAPAPHGMPVSVFMILGYGVWNIISQSINKCMSAVKSNLNLLTFPQVTELDVMVGRVLVIYVTQILVTIILLIAAEILVTDLEFDDFGLLFACIFLVPLFGFGCGLILTAFAVYFPVLEKLVPMVLRLLFFISGVFFTVQSFSDDIASILIYNPIYQFIDLLRCSMSFSYPRTDLSLIYVSVITLVVLSLGLLLERYVRTRRQR